MEIVLTGQESRTLRAEPRDAMLFVAMDKDDIVELRGLAWRLSQKGSTDASAVWEEVAAYEKLREEWRNTGINEELWQRHLAVLAEQAATGKPLSGTQEAAFALGTLLEIRQREVRASDNDVTAVHIGEEILSPLFFAAAKPPPGGGFHGELLFNGLGTALVLQPGSRIARLVVGGAFQFVSWTTGLAARFRSPEAAGTDIMVRLRQKREAQGAYPLLRLDRAEPLSSKLAGKRGALIFLHGLLSTDLGTFDAFIKRWLDPAPVSLPPMLTYAGQAFDKSLPEAGRQAIATSVALIGWPHDTLVKINKNAEDLALLVDRDLGPLDCPIAFVCHSRGGLVARSVAEKLFDKNPTWLARIRCALTFGTPHDGAEFAEHPDTGTGAFLLAGCGTGSIAGVVDVLAYVRQRRTLEGILDLRPRGASGSNFLEDLFDKEFKSCVSGPRRLTIVAIGGSYRGRAPADPLYRRLARAYVAAYTGEEENDIVVTRASATAADTSGAPHNVTDCDHFSYFEPEQCSRPHVDAVIHRLWESFTLTPTVEWQLAAAARDARSVVNARGIIDRLIARRREATKPDKPN